MGDHWNNIILLDFSILNDQSFRGRTIDFYDKKTKDLLQNIPIPTSSGYSNILINKGDISNKGIELAMNFDVVSNDDEFPFGGNIVIQSH